MANAHALASSLSIDASTCLGNGLSGRSGPIYKDSALIRFTGSGWENIGTWRGYAQRNRIVHMSSAAVNAGLRPLFSLLHGARKRIPGLWHGGGMDELVMRGQQTFYESDISGFDVSVTRELQTMIAWHLSVEFPHLKEAINFWLAAETLPMIGPSWARTHGACSTYRFLGGTRSGLKTTAEVGTLFSLIAALYALSRHGLDVFKWPFLRDAKLLVQGDDILVATERRLDAATWSAAYAELGLKATLLDGNMFLSRHHDGSGQSFPSAGRIAQQTISNEHEPHGEPEVTDGILALGFIARTEGAELLPKDLRTQSATICRHAEWFDRFDIPNGFRTDIADTRKWLRLSTKVQGAIRTALDARASLPWLARELRDREHSPSSRYIVHLLEQKRPDLLAQVTSQDQAVANIIKARLTDSRSDRLRDAAHFSNIAMTDKKAADDVLFTLLAQHHQAPLQTTTIEEQYA